ASSPSFSPWAAWLSTRSRRSSPARGQAQPDLCQTQAHLLIQQVGGTRWNCTLGQVPARLLPTWAASHRRGRPFADRIYRSAVSSPESTDESAQRATSP